MFTCGGVGGSAVHSRKFDVIFVSESVKYELGAVLIRLSLIAGYMSFN